MGRGRHKAKLNQFAGERLKIAREKVFGGSRIELAKLQRWKDKVGVEATTIERYENSKKPKGMPENKILRVADFFNVPNIFFTDEKISEKNFVKALLIRKENPKGNIDHLYKSKINSENQNQISRFIDELQFFENTEEIENKIKIHFDRGLEYQTKREYDHAILEYDKVIKLQPSVAEAFRNRGFCYLRKYNHEKCNADYKIASIINAAEICYNQSIQFLHRGELQQSLNAGLEAIKIYPDYINPYFLVAFAFQVSEKYTKAIEHYSFILKRFPHHYLTLFNRGKCLMEINNFDGAIKDFDEAIKQKPDFSPALELKKSCLKILNEFAEELSASNSVICENPNTWDAYYKRSKCLYTLNKYEEAINDLKFLIKNDPEPASAYYNLAVIYASCPNKEIQDNKTAMEYAEKAASEKPKPEYLNLLAVTYSNNRLFDKAVKAQKKAIKKIKINNETSGLLKAYNDYLKKLENLNQDFGDDLDSFEFI